MDSSADTATMTGDGPQIYLASSSPRRRELLDQIGVRYHVLPVDADEHRHAGESPRDYVLRMARTKARLAAADPGRVMDIPVLAADTVVVIDGEVLGKPTHREHAESMLARLSGRVHEVLTAVAVMHRTEGVRISATQVEFRPIDPVEAAAYWATGEPLDKAGAYAIQGRGAVFVARLEGSYSGVVGLPLFEVAQLLREYHVACLYESGAIGADNDRRGI